MSESIEQPVRIITHSGTFHADELLACAAILIFLNGKPFEIIRTRDSKIIATGDFVIDVGAEYDPATNRFDHHQYGGAGTRENGIPYSAFGLVWKQYGETICGSKEVADAIDRHIGHPVDMGDNGMDYYTTVRPDTEPLILQFVVAMFRPTWKGEATHDERFMELVVFMKRLLQLEITVEQNRIEGSRFVEVSYVNAVDKRVIVLDGPYPWHEVLARHPEPLYVVKPKTQNDFWEVECVRDSINGFANRKNLPESWAGKFEEELSTITGIPDAVFCHNRLYIAVAKTKESALKLALMALDA
jgi:uncharacterized UPF0160 family protein